MGESTVKMRSFSQIRGEDFPQKMKPPTGWIYPPPRIPVANEGLFIGIPDPKNGEIIQVGDWNPGWGVDLTYRLVLSKGLDSSKEIIRFS